MTDTGPWNDFVPPAAPIQEPQSGPWDDFKPAQATEAAPPPVDAPTRQMLEPRLAPIMRAFREGFSEGWGPENMGISDENTKKLQELGFFRTMNDDRWNPFKAANELLLDQGTRVAETLIRGGTGLFRGAQAAAVEAGAPRDIAALPEAFLGMPHPLGIPKEFVKPSPIEPILHDEAPAPASVRSRAELARTGDPVVDGVLNDPVINGVINKAVIDREHTIPYEAGGSEPIDNPTTYVDKHVPQTFTVPRVSDPTKTVTIDTGEPAAIHENVEMFVEQKLTDGGMTKDEAYRVAHFDFAQMAEHAWYAANDVDPVAVEAEWKKIQPGIQHQIANETPPDLYQKEYPGADVTKARHEEIFESPPTPEESLRGREIMQRALVDDEAARAVERQAPDLAEARGLNVIGPEERPELNSVEDVDRVMAARRAPDEKITQEVGGGKPVDPWEERWKKFTSKIDKPQDVQEIIRDPALDDPDRFGPARRGEIPMVQLTDLAQAGGVDPAVVDRAGVGRTLQNDAQVRIAMKALMQAAEDVKAAAEAHGTGPTDLTRIKLQETIMRRDIVLEQVLGFRGEWGRTGNVFQEFLKEVKDQEGLSRFMDERGRKPADLDEIAEHIRGLSANQAARYLSQQRELKPTGFPHWMWTQSLISGLVTHTKYFLANAIYTTTERVIVPTIAATVGAILRSPDRVLFGEAAMGAMGLIYSTPRALAAAGRAWKTGTRIALDSEVGALEKFQAQYDARVAAGQAVPKELLKQIKELTKAADQISPYAEPPSVQRARTALQDLPGIWGRIAYTGSQIITPGNMAMALHTTYKVMGEQASLSAQAYRAVVREGEHAVHSAEFWDRYDHHMANPTLEMQMNAVRDAYKGTFMQELGPHGKRWSTFTKEQPGVRWVFPFAHIPVNIMKATYEHTPFALLDGEMRADLAGRNGAVKRDVAVSHIMVGAGIMGLASYMALKGDATGDLPRDAKELRQWKQNGTQPNSIRMGDWWVSINKLGPFGNLMQIAADFTHQAHKISEDEDSYALRAVVGMAGSAAKMVKDEVGFLSVAMLYDAMMDPKKGEKWVANTAISMVPYSSMLGQTAAMMDPSLREVKSFIDALKYKIPGARETLPSKRDVFGEPMVNPLYHSVLRVAPAATDKVHTEMDRLGLFPATPRNNVGGIQLPPALYDKYLVTRGTLTREHIEAYMRQPSWETMPDGVKADLIQKTFKDAGEQARAMIQVERPDLITQGVDNKISAITGKKPVKKLPETATP